MRPWQIYTLTDPRDQAVRYVGVTFRAKQRFTEHISKAIRGGQTHRDCWIRSLLTEGFKPLYRVVSSGSSADWQRAECRWIAKLRLTCDLLNHTDGGEGTPGIVPSPELRRKWSLMRKGVKYAPDRTRPMAGKRHSEEAREKIRQASTGRAHTPEAKAKVSAARLGQTLTQEHREKLSKAHQGKVLTLEHRRKIAATTTNRRPILCVETGEIFASVTAASKALGVSESSIYQAVQKPCRCKGFHLRDL